VYPMTWSVGCGSSDLNTPSDQMERDNAIVLKNLPLFLSFDRGFYDTRSIE
jgi:hypothetical protein